MASPLRYTQPLRNFPYIALSEPPMRACLSLLLMLMLALRGLMGDAMAMGMVAPVMPAAMAEHHSSNMADHAGMDTGHVMAASSHCDTGQQVSHHSDPSDHSQHDPAQHGASCSACGICHSAVDLFTGAGFAALAAPSLARASGSAPFASALLAQASKPPIS
ncbi:hypothetical protein GCM10027276_34940 [Comamonas piscis]